MSGLVDTRAKTLQVSAIGGEGGGVLATWIVAAAQRAGYPVQSTSIPGVAQRTGATIYYIEVFPVSIADLDGKRPVMALYPGVGDIDIMLASEFAEAGRAISNGFVTPDRTHLIASTHRVYAIGERSDMADGRYDVERLFTAVRERTKQAYLADFRQVAEAHGVSLNAILLGIFWKRFNAPGAISGMVVGILSTGGYIIYFKFLGGDASDWFLGISPEGIGVLGMLLNFAVAIPIALNTAPPHQDIQDMVKDIRLPVQAED